MKDQALVVHSDPDILGGTPVFVGTRVPLRNLIDYLERGHSLDEFLDAFPSVSRQQAVAATYARKERLVALLRREGSKSEQQIATLEEKAKRLERLIDVLSRQSSGTTVQEDIRTVAGALGWPVQGRVIEAFGRQVDPKFSTITFNNGLKIAAAPGTDVHAIFPGTVLFSQWFKGYGNLIILDHGNRVFSLYGNLKSPAVTVGDRVSAGQAIAGVGEAEEAQAGYLYFEIRQDKKPEDPQKWLR